MAIITANRELEVAKLQKEQADQIKQAAILKAEGEAKAQELMAQARKKLMEADNALQAKLDAYVEVNRAYADAISKIHLPNVVMTSDGKNSGSNAAMDILDLIKVKTAKDLALDTTVR
jgi:regulator of protease activity HflC (stomatin/prohibitin superfamily)